jgi:hypothetical protein
MQPRIKNPMMAVPGAIEALQKLSAAARKAWVACRQPCIWSRCEPARSTGAARVWP